MADHTITDNSESDFAHFCLDFFSITAYLNDSATPLIDVNQIHLYIPLNGYMADLSGFFISGGIVRLFRFVQITYKMRGF
ncbi:hypothetical protein DU811_22775 [Salmonella enterica subsp. enterica]|nr:hypothetical protein [Salmonella enterica subsp. enterica]EBY6725858.1 hypothetical protein [Salmonella enterica subsp. enterica serovar Ndolo]